MKNLFNISVKKILSALIISSTCLSASFVYANEQTNAQTNEQQNPQGNIYADSQANNYVQPDEDYKRFYVSSLYGFSGVLRFSSEENGTLSRLGFKCNVIEAGYYFTPNFRVGLGFDWDFYPQAFSKSTKITELEKSFRTTMATLKEIKNPEDIDFSSNGWRVYGNALFDIHSTPTKHTVFGLGLGVGQLRESVNCTKDIVGVNYGGDFEGVLMQKDSVIIYNTGLIVDLNFTYGYSWKTFDFLFIDLYSYLGAGYELSALSKVSVVRHNKAADVTKLYNEDLDKKGRIWMNGGSRIGVRFVF